jgi:hypothetical protein
LKEDTLIGAEYKRETVISTSLSNLNVPKVQFSKYIKLTLTSFFGLNCSIILHATVSNCQFPSKQAANNSQCHEFSQSIAQRQTVIGSHELQLSTFTFFMEFDLNSIFLDSALSLN